MHHLVHRPGPLLGAFVDCLWLQTGAPRHARERIVPSGTVELVFNLHADEFRIYEPLTGTERRFRGAIASGCYSKAFEFDTRAHVLAIGVHFKPGGAASVLGAPPGELADAHVSLDDLWGQGVSELRERLCAAADSGQRFDFLEAALIERIRGRGPRRPAVGAGLAELEQAGVEVASVAEMCGLSRRRFIEVFTEDVGMTPKRYARVRRFQRALALASRSPSPAWARLALETGYFDQAHLCRDWAAFTGMSPSEYLKWRSIRVKENHVALPDGGSHSSKPRSRSPT